MKGLIFLGGCILFGCSHRAISNTSDGGNIPSDGGNIPSDGGSIPSDGGSIPSEDTMISTPDTPPTSGIDWYKIPPGTFQMGSTPSEPCRSATGIKETQHLVTLTHYFEIQTTEVTQDQFQSVMNDNPSSFSWCGGTCPVEQVNWHQATAYCNRLSEMKGLSSCYTCMGIGKMIRCTVKAHYTRGGIYNCPGYRLPTEAEWEYAYRAGSSTAFYNGSITDCQNDSKASQIGWYSTNSTNRPHPVGQKQKNAWGLYDMAGNVWEWTQDLFQKDLGAKSVTNPYGATGDGSYVIRGSSWFDAAAHLRAAYRFGYSPQTSNTNIGFRCARSF